MRLDVCMCERARVFGGGGGVVHAPSEELYNSNDNYILYQMSKHLHLSGKETDRESPQLGVPSADILCNAFR